MTRECVARAVQIWKRFRTKDTGAQMTTTRVRQKPPTIVKYSNVVVVASTSAIGWWVQCITDGVTFSLLFPFF
jgi:hypothetical protein